MTSISTTSFSASSIFPAHIFRGLLLASPFHLSERPMYPLPYEQQLVSVLVRVSSELQDTGAALQGKFVLLIAWAFLGPRLFWKGFSSIVIKSGIYDFPHDPIEST